MDGLCLTPPPDLCCVSLQARMAGERGASAVLFDITEDRAAAEQVPWMRGAWGVGGGGGRKRREREVLREQKSGHSHPRGHFLSCSCSSPWG